MELIFFCRESGGGGGGGGGGDGGHFNIYIFVQWTLPLLSRGWSLETTSRVVVVEVLCEKVLRRSKG